MKGHSIRKDHTPSPQGELAVKHEMTCDNMVDNKDHIVAELRGQHAKDIAKLLQAGEYILQVFPKENGNLLIVACKP